MSAATATVGTDVSLWDRIRTYSPPPRFLPLIVTIALFAGMFGAGSVRYENFGDPQVFLSLMINNAHLIVLAVGMTFVILTGGIDLSVGSLLALAGMAAAIVAKGTNARIPAHAAELLAGSPESGTVDAHGIQTFYSGLIAREAGMAVTLGLEGDEVTIQAADA